MSALDAYNVFLRKETPALRCAVRQDRPVPDFVRGDVWEYAGTVDAGTAPAGFKVAAARQATSHVGYYVFFALTA
ncbi:hypothetical protein M446_0567 [Methylobacterium sp. 4-46]|uniref:hypothetical protein n=1 Tax=unclassified Methylobacterium TaxID=2615210 RepID=UPI000165CA3C|nr:MULTISPECIES: hypothetical protein [Methylobacterium]ACA15129.1 hypothetical protein M446_0567 [Methylobacterium sp. 4-46]WFT80862.1 hypothetical protein QA634_02875 [Methylobacterium nodulans]